jgi:hypothetical protein
LLRDHGLRLVTLAERYGNSDDERVTDERWLRDAGRLGEVVFIKDARVRYKMAWRTTMNGGGRGMTSDP